LRHPRFTLKTVAARRKQQRHGTYASRVEWLVAVGFFAALTAIAVVLLSWRDRRRGPVCPWCGQPDTFGPDEPDVCDNCGFDFRRDAN
jgi:hypothetical protein